MDTTDFNDHFVRFPYRAEVRDNGDINNGGIDLVKEHERIGELHELVGADWLKEFVETTNKPCNLFMTFGCVWDREPDEDIYGYVEFSLRPDIPVELRRDIAIASLDKMFYTYLKEVMVSAQAENPAQVTEYARNALLQEITPLEIYGETYQKVSLVFRVEHHEATGWLFDHLTFFLNSYYMSLPHVATV